MHRWLRSALISVVFAALAPSAAQATVAVGQTFVAPSTDTFLQSVFTGLLDGATSGASYVYELFAFSGSQLTGTALFQFAETGVVFDNQTIPVNVLLTAGQEYAFVLATDTGVVGAASAADFISSGSVIVCDPIFAVCTAPVGPNDVHDFAANFTAVPAPEPATLALLALGFAGLGFSRRRKQ